LDEDARSLAGLQEEMDMIGHQTKCVDLHTVVGLPRLQGVQVIGVGVIPCEDDLAVMTTLDDMMRIMLQDRPRLSKHTRERLL
jgi:hypothetical protein